MELRYYQKEAVERTFEYFKTNKEGHPLIAMPTGTGKSLVIAGFLKETFKRYGMQKILVLTHSQELIEQNHEKLLTLWPSAPCGIYSAGLKKRDFHSNIIFAGVASAVNCAEKFGKVDLILIDEAHRVSKSKNTGYQKLITKLLNKNPKLRIIGLTATCWRTSEGKIFGKDNFFSDVCYDLTSLENFNKLLDEGYLCHLVPKPTKLSYDLSKVKIRAGEFVQKDLQKAVNKSHLTRSAILESIELGKNRHTWLVFTTGIEHARDTCDMLNEYGIKSRCVHSSNDKYKMNNSQRTKNIEDFKSGKYKALVNCGTLTTGFDHSQIDLLIILRPMMSSGLWVQILGRGTRTVYQPGYDLTCKNGRLLAVYNSVKRNCLVLDFGGNTKRLGPINDVIIPKSKKSKSKGEAPVKICPKCESLIHASLRVCNVLLETTGKLCGHKFPVQNKLTEVSDDQELIRIKKIQKPKEEKTMKNLDIDRITYSKHVKAGSETLKVSYYCKYARFDEYIGIAHSSLRAKNHAKYWWKCRSSNFLPSSVDEALQLSDYLRSPKSIEVQFSNLSKYPKIKKVNF